MNRKPFATLPERRTLTAATVLFALTMTTVTAWGASALDNEIYYIRFLGESLRMSDYAEFVLHRVKAAYPEAGPRLKVLQIEQQLSQGKFDDVQRIIDAEPDKEAPETWAMRATKADYLFAFGHYDEAFGTYEALYKKYSDKPPEALSEFYFNSMYKYGQMLIRTNKDRKAYEIYKTLLAVAKAQSEKLKKLVKDEASSQDYLASKQMTRQIQFEAAELAINNAAALPTDAKPAPKGAAPAAGSRAYYLAEGQKLCEGILWDQDLWFAKGVALLARIKVITGDVDGAHKLIDGYMETIVQIDKNLMDQGREFGEDNSRLSPVAQCRFLTGRLLYDEAQKILDEAGDGELSADVKKQVLELLVGKPNATPPVGGAYQEFINVYVKYPAANDAPEAMNLAEAIEELLINRHLVKSFKKNITPEQRAEVSRRQFENAQVSFNEQNYPEAISRYESILNKYPREVPDSILGLSALARSYIASYNPADEATAIYELYADMTVAHLAETFCKNKAGMELAGNEIRAIAEFWASDKGNAAKREAVYDVFFTLFPEHTSAAPLIWSKADRAYRAEDYETALTNFTRLADLYLKSPLSINALSRIAEIQKKLNNSEAEIAAYQEIVKRLEATGKPSFLLLSTRCQIAAALRAAVNPEELRSSDQAVMGPALKKVRDAATLFRAINTLMDDPAKIAPYATSDEDKAKLAQLRETSGMGVAGSYSLLASLNNLPENATKQFRELAIQAFEDVLAKFPQSERGASVLNQIGTLWTAAAAKATDEAAKKEFNEKADAAFSRLAKTYPESEEAKLALFMQGRALIELGFASEGREKFVLMLKDTSKYRPAQMLAVGDALRDGRQEDLAFQAYEDAIKRAGEDEAVRMRATLGRSQVLAAQGKTAEAIEGFQTFVQEFPKSSLALDANLQLSRAAAKEASENKDPDERIRLFKVSVEAMKAVRKYYNARSFEIDRRIRAAQQADPPQEVNEEDFSDLASIQGKLAETDNDIGNILILESKTVDAEDTETYRRKAVAHFVKIMDGVNPSALTPEVSPHLQKAFRTGIDLLYEIGEFSDCATFAEAYLNAFPTGLFNAEIKLRLQEANARL